ncbi:MAG: putative sugar phosphate isomerase YwlF [Alphaproteobacteria bacterium ADurb.Bin438]|nr:MAG: putative sugar phosphate isomerase YwlF [Alphaproteobacteria bacterium ADurb.Bin438]
MKILIGSDHGGFNLKEVLKNKLKEIGHEIVDIGCESVAAVDYPDISDKMALAIKEEDEKTRGILVCGTGIGISIKANRYPHVRCALVHDGFTARLCREHNDANVMALGGRVLGDELAIECMEIFLKTDFIPKESYVRRVKKLGEC